MIKEIKHPATCVCHWATGPVNTCDRHAQQIQGLGRVLGAHVAVTELTEPAECSNCVNETKANDN